MEDTYTNDVSQPLNFIECVQLLQKLVEKNYIQKDPKDENCILVYRERGAKAPEGWYSENLLSCANEVLEDITSQTYLCKTLEDDGIELKFDATYKWLSEICHDFNDGQKDVQSPNAVRKKENMER